MRCRTGHALRGVWRVKRTSREVLRRLWHHLARLRGDAPAARREIEEARRCYAEMGATAQTERLAKELDGYA